MTQDSSAHTVWSELKYSCTFLEGVSANDLKGLRFISSWQIINSPLLDHSNL